MNDRRRDDALLHEIKGKLDFLSDHLKDCPSRLSRVEEHQVSHEQQDEKYHKFGVRAIIVIGVFLATVHAPEAIVFVKDLL